jgi:hypothetical protein
MEAQLISNPEELRANVENSALNVGSNFLDKAKQVSRIIKNEIENLELDVKNNIVKDKKFKNQFVLHLKKRITREVYGGTPPEIIYNVLHLKRGGRIRTNSPIVKYDTLFNTMTNNLNTLEKMNEIRQKTDYFYTNSENQINKQDLGEKVNKRLGLKKDKGEKEHEGEKEKEKESSVLGSLKEYRRKLIQYVTDANYVGSGTPLLNYIERGIEPNSDLDMIAFEHDIKYTLATSDEEINKADKIFIKRLNNQFHNKPSISGMLAGTAINVKAFIDKILPTERLFYNKEENKRRPEYVKEFLREIDKRLSKKETLNTDTFRNVVTDDLVSEFTQKRREIEGPEEEDDEEEDDEDEDELDEEINKILQEDLEEVDDEEINELIKELGLDPQLITEGDDEDDEDDESASFQGATGPRGALEQPPLGSLPTFTPTLAGDPVSLPSRAGPTSQPAAPKTTLRVQPHATMNPKERARQNMIQREQYLFQADEEGQNVAPPVPNTYARPGFPTQWLDIEKFKNYQTAEYKKEQDEIWIRNNQTPFQYGAGTVDNSVKDIKNVSERLAAIEDYIRYELATNQFPEDESRTGYYFGQPQKRLGRIPTSHHERWDAYVKMNKDMSKYTHTQRVNEPTRNKLINRNVNYELTQIKPGQQVLYDELELEEPHKFDIKNNKDLQYYIRKYRKR